MGWMNGKVYLTPFDSVTFNPDAFQWNSCCCWIVKWVSCLDSSLLPFPGLASSGRAINYGHIQVVTIIIWGDLSVDIQMRGRGKGICVKWEVFDKEIKDPEGHTRHISSQSFVRRWGLREKKKGEFWVEHFQGFIRKDVEWDHKLGFRWMAGCFKGGGDLIFGFKDFWRCFSWGPLIRLYFAESLLLDFWRVKWILFGILYQIFSPLCS